MSCADGVLLVDKPSGMTSHDVVDAIRRRFFKKKVGHAGTLDPFATGLLVILLGSFTKKSIQFSGYDKEYEAVLKLGVATDTCDIEGKILEEKEINDVTKEKIEKAFGEFSGEIQQIPPMFSAKKIKGKKLYELARKGIELTREPKTVWIRKIEIRDFSVPLVSFYVKCSKGTYIRQLADDIGKRLKCGAHLVSLKRTAIGPFELAKSVALNDAKNEDILQP